jgi:tubulin-specific chaperone B
MNRDAQAVKGYVMAADHLQYTQLADGTVQVNVTHSNLRQFVQELRLDLHTPVGEIKRKLYTHNGSSIDAMELQLRDREGNTVCRMLDDSRPLGFYGVSNGMTIHVVDNDPFSLSRDGGLDDVSRIEKYRMSEEEYDSREKSYRAWRRKMEAEKPGWKPPHLQKPAGGAGAGGAGAGGSGVDYTDAGCTAGFLLGNRCSVTPGDRRGEVAYVGEVEGIAAGYWIGVRLDEPLGKNDGKCAGKTYFEAQPGYGAFVRPDRVAVGAFRPIWEEEMEGLVGGGDGDAAAAEGAAAAAAPSKPAGATTESKGDDEL